MLVWKRARAPGSLPWPACWAACCAPQIGLLEREELPRLLLGRLPLVDAVFLFFSFVTAATIEHRKEFAVKADELLKGRLRIQLCRKKELEETHEKRDRIRQNQVV